MSQNYNKFKWKNYAQDELDACNLVLVSKTVGMHRYAIEDDVNYILYAFLNKPTHSFQTFDDLWHELHFSHVHFGCVKRDYRDRYMDAFFSCFLDHFKSNLVPIQCGVIFSLYFLYMSQPSVWGKNRIRVTQEIFQSLFQFYMDSIQQDKNIEAALIFDKLRKMEAFLFVAEQEPEHRYYKESIEFIQSIKVNQDIRGLKKRKSSQDPMDLCTNEDIREYKRLASTYQTSKRNVFYTKQATKAAQAMFKEKTNVIEHRPHILQKVILNSSLAQDESDTLQLLTQSYKQMTDTINKKNQS